MKLVHIRKRFILVVLCTILLTLFFAPIYSDHLVMGLWDSLLNNETARISFYNIGIADNAVKLTDVETSAPYEAEYPQSCNNEKGQCAAVNINVVRKWQDFAATIKIKGNGKFTVNLRGAYAKDGDDNLYPVLVDYRFANINNRSFLSGRKSFEHDRPHTYTFDVKDGDVLKFFVQVRKHHFRFSDLTHFYKVNWLLFISVLVISFLLSYKLIQYISKFKLLEHNSRIDIVFVAVFFVLLFVPMSHISSAEKSMQENRMLATYPKLFNKVLNLEYGKQFETWFNDRFFGRSLFLGFQNDLNFYIQKYIKNQHIIKALDDTMFERGALEMLMKPVSKENMQKISSNIKKIQEFCKQNNIDLYIMIPPTKEDIYKDKLKSVYKNIAKKNYINELVQYIEEQNHLKIIYPRNLFIQSQSEYTHYITDHHWSEYGAFLGYQSLMKAIQEKYQDVEVLQDGDFNVFYDNRARKGIYDGLYNRIYLKGTNCSRLGLKEKCPDKFYYIYYNHKDRDRLDINYGPLKWSRVTHYDKGYDKNVTYISNSYGGYWLEFLPYTFKSVQMLRANTDENLKNDWDLKRFEPHILGFKTNILVIAVPSSYIYELKRFFED